MTLSNENNYTQKYGYAFVDYHRLVVTVAYNKWGTQAHLTVLAYRPSLTVVDLTGSDPSKIQWEQKLIPDNRLWYDMLFRELCYVT